MKRVQEKYYNRGCRQLPTLKIGDIVRIAPHQGKEWIKGKVMARNNDRQYTVLKENGNSIKRNRQHLRKVNEPMIEKRYEGMDLSYGDESKQ